jgi:glycosyltransferase involved in cell wall biosynthesis
VSRALHWLSPGDPKQRTGGFIYNARVIDALRDAGRAVAVHALPGEWPWPTRADVAACCTQLQTIPEGEPILADGLLWPALGLCRPEITARNPGVVLVHSLLDKEGAANADRLMAIETEAIAASRGWIATSGRTASLVRQRVGPQPAGMVVIPGCDPSEMSRGSGGTRLLCVATVTPRKGHALLIEALAGIEDIDWTLDCAGSTDRDAACAEAVRDTIARLGVAGRVNFLGELTDDALASAYDAADILVHAASFEGYGMGLAEALARGLPVVSTPAGALDDVPASAAIVVEPGDVNAMRGAIAGLLRDPDRRVAMAAAAGAIRWPTWDEVAASVGAAIDRFSGAG